MKSGVNQGIELRVLLVIFAITFNSVFGQGRMAHAQPAEQIFKSAGKLYQTKQFPQAAEEYEQLISKGYNSPEIYYNLGNCFYKMDNVGKSILAYERALKISPKDPDIRHNLKLAEMKRMDHIEAVLQPGIIRLWKEFITLQSSKGWGIFSLTTIWISLLVFTISFFLGNRKVFRWIAVFFLIVSFSMLSLAFMQKQSDIHSDSAILMVSNTLVKSAPDAGAGDLFMIHEGIKIKILDYVGSWSKISLEDGKIGWIEKEKFQMI